MSLDLDGGANAQISKPGARFLQAATSASLSVMTVSGLAGTYRGETNSVQVQAFNVNGVASTSGGDVFFLRVENFCTVTVNHRCDLSPDSANLSELPILTQMTDLGDGTYTSTYVITEYGPVTVSVELMNVGGLYAEYFNNNSLTGVP